MKSFSLYIPEPCHEDWDKMTPNEQGRFCASCKKTVVDFTKMDREQIATYFLSHKSVCGKLRKNQLQQTYTKSSFLYETVRRVAIVASLSLVGLQFTQAQNEVPKIEQVAPKNADNEKSSCKTEKHIAQRRIDEASFETNAPTFKGKAIFKRTYGNMMITGKLYGDEEKTKPLQNAHVSFIGSNHTVQTDENGRFVLLGGKTKKKSVSIQILKPNYEPFFKAYKVKKKQNTLTISEFISLSSASSETIILGGVIAGVQIKQDKSDSLRTELLKKELFK